MMLDWFNAREAIQVGSTLADSLLKPSGTGSRHTASRPKDGRAEVQKFLQRALREIRPLKLNLFKRSKLLTAFKWKLLENGYDRTAAEELTHTLLMQLYGDKVGKAALLRSGATSGSSSPPISSRRAPAALAEADALFAQRNFAGAIERFQEGLALDSRNALARAKLGEALCSLGRYQEGEQEFRRAVSINPNCWNAHLGLGTLLRARAEFGASETALRRAVKQNPRHPEPLVSLGLTLGMQGRLSETRSCFEKALRLKPRDPSALCALGWLAKIEGRFEEAERLYRSALESDAADAFAWASLVELRRMTPSDTDWLAGAERALAGGLQPHTESQLRFAMGKYFDDLGQFSRAFEQYRRANELAKMVASPYERDSRTRLVDATIATYTRERLAQPAPGASPSEQPVLVIGMMRSGTSLVEQIIASHPQAAGAGELDFWNAQAIKHRETLRRQPPDAALTKRLAEGYLKELSRCSAAALRIVDKSTVNSDHVGLIHAVFPRARFVYLRRDPIDTCLSTYFQSFAASLNHTMDLEDLAHYYREHHRLIDHWRSALPSGTLLEVPYAELVADQQIWSRRIVDFIGLEWDPRCLEFHQTDRPVLTASHWQVRQRIYKSSIERWRNYEKFIGPLLGLRKLSG
jgi:tetratricopeptide (TPR) repeat protein